MPTIELLVRRRFVPLEGAIAVRVAANAWELEIPTTPTVSRLMKNAADPTAWDGAVFSLDGREAQPAVGSGTTATGVKVTVVVV